MRIERSDKFESELVEAPPKVQVAFYKQARLLADNIRHPSLHAKKYNESQDVWQARVNKDWRFFFTISGDAYTMIHIGPHPK